MITGVTRKAIVDLFNNFNSDPLGINSLLNLGQPQPIGIAWWGEIDEIKFLQRIYDLKELPSSDSRYDDAEGDIRQHRYANDDWENDWIFGDERFGLQTSDKALLKFLTETLHPEVRSDKELVRKIRDALNELLKADLYELKQYTLLSGRPVFKAVTIEAPKITRSMLQEEISQAIRVGTSAYHTESYCDGLGLPKAESDIEPMTSKAAYVKERTKSLDRPALIKLARNVLDDHKYEPLVELIARLDMQSNSRLNGKPKNLIFAANGPKPEIYLADSVNNDVKINKNAEYCLIYEDDIDPNQGLAWEDLLAWWMDKRQIADKKSANSLLYKRLLETCNDAEKIIFNAYGFLIKERGFGMPALIPQVYLHFDPLTAAQRITPGPLARQRMDFLMLLPGRHRVVIELDGVQHYADDTGKASPKLYSKMMAEDRKLRLQGYEVYRFGGADFTNKAQANIKMTEFFEQLLARYQVN